MSDGGWIVLGAAVGAMGSIATTWLNAWFARGRPDYFDKVAIKVLKSELANGQGQNAQELANLIGLSVTETKQLLLIAGATGDRKDPRVWRLGG